MQSSQQSGSTRQLSMDEALTQGHAVKANEAIARFFYGNAISFNACRSLTFKEMVTAVSLAGEGFTFRGVRWLTNEGLTNEVRSLQHRSCDARMAAKQYGLSLVLDGKTDSAGRSLINLLLGHERGLEHIDTFNAAPVTKKTGLFICALIRAYLKDEGEDDGDEGEVDATQLPAGFDDDDDEEELPLSDVLLLKKVKDDEAISKIHVRDLFTVIIDGGKNYRKGGRLLEAKYPHLFISVDSTHSSDLLMKDVYNIDFVKTLLEEGKEIAFFFKNHDATKRLMANQTKLKMVVPANTRFKYAYLVLVRLKQLQPALEACVITASFNAWVDGEKADVREVANDIKARILNRAWWTRLTRVLAVLKPIAVVTNKFDRSTGAAGLVYVTMLKLRKEYLHGGSAVAAGAPVDICRKVAKLVEERHDYMHSTIHGAAALLDPRVWSDRDNDWSQLRSNSDCRRDWQAALRKMFPDDLEAQKKANVGMRELW